MIFWENLKSSHSHSYNRTNTNFLQDSEDLINQKPRYRLRTCRKLRHKLTNKTQRHLLW